MKVLIQRVNKADCKVDGKIIGKIEQGIVIFVGFTIGDTSKEIDYMVNKIINLRIFDDENGIMNKSLININGSILSISQFTLYTNSKKGNRPSYTESLPSQQAIKLYNEFNEKLKKENIKTETGKFGADMKISLVNDGPVTIILEKENKK